MGDYWVIRLIDAPLTPIYLAHGGYSTTAEEAAQFATNVEALNFLYISVAPLDYERWAAVTL